jgi:hypothetical protein
VIGGSGHGRLRRLGQGGRHKGMAGVGADRPGQATPCTVSTGSPSLLAAVVGLVAGGGQLETMGVALLVLPSRSARPDGRYRRRLHCGGQGRPSDADDIGDGPDGAAGRATGPTEGQGRLRKTEWKGGGGAITTPQKLNHDPRPHHGSPMKVAGSRAMRIFDVKIGKAVLTACGPHPSPPPPPPPPRTPP